MSELKERERNHCAIRGKKLGSYSLFSRRFLRMCQKSSWHTITHSFLTFSFLARVYKKPLPNLIKA